MTSQLKEVHIKAIHKTHYYTYVIVAELDSGTLYFNEVAGLRDLRIKLDQLFQLFDFPSFPGDSK
jgi:hypothetical protein